MNWKDLLQYLEAANYVYCDSFALTAACYVSRQWIGEPLWLLMIAPPGSGKTCTVQQFQGASQTEFVSALTPAYLVTAWGGPENDRSLFSDIDGKLLVIKDFGTILSMPWAEIQAILSYLREAFDGHVKKGFARITREYFLHFNIIACSTEAVYHHLPLWSQLGDRFIRFEPKPPILPWPPPEIKEIARDAVTQWCLDHQATEAPTDLDISWAIDLAELLAVLRTELPHDSRTHEISEVRRPERPVRLAKQLSKLYRALMYATDGDQPYCYQMTVDCARSSIPHKRLRLLEQMWAHEALDFASLKNLMGLGPTALRMLLADLEVLGILEKGQIKQGFQKRYEWSVPKDLRSIFEDLLGTP